MKKESKKRYTFFSDIRKNKLSYLMLLPAGVYVALFGYMTLPYIVIAFQDFNYNKGILGSKFVGLKNFRFFFQSNRAALVTFNTVFLNSLFIIFGTISAVLLALLFNEIRSKKYLKVTQSLVLFPNFLSWIIVNYIVYALLSTEYGWINEILKIWGAGPISMYSNAEPWPFILLLIRIWKNAGLDSVIYMAAILGIDESYYEAARIDGATRLQQIRYITLPLISSTICILTLLAIGKIFYGDFQMIYSLVGDNGILLKRTDVIDTFVYRALRQTGDPSAAMAVGLYQAVVGFVLVFGSNLLAKKYFPSGSIF